MSIKSSVISPPDPYHYPAKPESSFKYHSKRMLVVASLYFGIKGTQRPDEKELEKVNQQFDLVWRPAALLFPAACAGLIWRKIDVSSLMTQYCQDETCLGVLTSLVQSAVPLWLWYSGLAEDIQAVFTSLRFA